MEALAAASIPTITDFKHQELVTTAWSFATLPLRHRPLMDSIAAASRASGFDPHSLAGPAWSFSTLACLNEPLLHAISAASRTKISDFKTQDLGNMAWSFATLQYHDVPLRAALAAAARRSINEFKTQELEMMLWAFARLACGPGHNLLESPELHRMLGPRGFGVLLYWFELNGSIGHQTQLLRQLSSLIGGAAPAAINVAALRLSQEGHTEAAIEMLCAADLQGCANENSVQILAACGGQQEFQGIPRINVAPSASTSARWQCSKAESLFLYVLSNAKPGDPAAVCAAIENFAAEVLRPSRQWLKVAGGKKAEVIVSAFEAAPQEGAILEIGTYFGYSALRLAMSDPDRSIITIEVDVVHAIVAQCLIMHAGLAHVIDVWTGHSQDVLPLIQQRQRDGRPISIAGMFMDQCGSRFWEDLMIVIRLGILAPGAVVVADNVLKPGAPVFLWHLFFGREFVNTCAISLEEFGMPDVEDWIAVSIFTGIDRPGDLELPTSLARELEDLEWEANRIRAKATGSGGVSFPDWKSHSAWMRERLMTLGISSTISMPPLVHPRTDPCLER